MIQTEIEHNMYRIAAEFIKKRYPIGWGGAAVVRTENNHYFTSVGIETANASAVLCIETGTICEAHKYNERVTHCLCLVRDNEYLPFRVLTPCGICQERLRFWGDDVRVAVTTQFNVLRFLPLSDRQPYHWTTAYTEEQLERFVENN